MIKKIQNLNDRFICTGFFDRIYLGYKSFWAQLYIDVNASNTSFVILFVHFHNWYYNFNVFLVYMIKLGTLENENTAEVEWRRHFYTRTSKKRKFLSVD